MDKSGKIAALYKEHFNSGIKTVNQVDDLSEIGKQEDINSSNRVQVVHIR